MAPVRRGVQPPTQGFYYHPSRHYSAGQPISWPGGPISSSLGSASPARAGAPRWTWSACLPPRTPKRGRRRAGEGPAGAVADRRGRAFVRLRRLLYDPVQVQSTGPGGMPGPDPRPFASGWLLLGRSRRAARPERPPSSPWT
jgi:hypothetical protein